MNRLTYTGLFYLALPLIFLRLMRHAKEIPEYRRRWHERLARYSRGPAYARKSRCIVFHAVSVGEVHAAVPLIRAILRELSDCSVVVTTTTPTGSARVAELLRGEVTHVYLPYDIPGALRRFLGYFRPDLLVVMETELWPNLIHYCHRRGVKVLLANARMSEKSARGYACFGHLTRKMLGQIDAVAAQSESDARRLRELGLPPQCLRITGSMKYDLDIPGTQVYAGRELKKAVAGGRPVLIAASTRDGEEEKVLEAYLQILEQAPELLLILVPRHPERFDRAWRLCRERGLAVRRRSEQAAAVPADQVQVLLGDSMGELLLFYAAADIAFVGGSLVDTGCQNILEPAALGLPVLTGPSLYNFRKISDQLREGGALRVVESPRALAAAVLELLGDAALRESMAAAATRVVKENRGATRRILDMAERLLPAMARD